MPALRRACAFALAVLPSVAIAQCATTWLPGAPVPGVLGKVYATTAWDPDGAGPAGERLVVAGLLTRAGEHDVTAIAAWDPTTGAWSALPGLGSSSSGLGTSAVASLLALPNGELVAAGNLYVAGAFERVARWNGQGWQGMSDGLSGNVRAFALYGGQVVAAGAFQDIGGTGPGQVAVHNGSSWEPLGTGFPASGNAIALLSRSDGTLLVGGTYFAPMGSPGFNLIQWDGQSWSGLGAASDFPALMLAELPSGEIVVATGQNSIIDGLSRVGIWDGVSWQSLGNVYEARAIAVSPSGTLYASGILFTGAFQGVLQWTGQSWSWLSDRWQAVDVMSILSGGELFVGGEFRVRGALNVARWDGVAFEPLLQGTDAPPIASASLQDGDVVVAGAFERIEGVLVNHIAKGRPGAWTPLGGGLDGTVRAVAELANGDIVAGGGFDALGDVARFDGVVWQPLGGGVRAASGGWSQVFALHVTANGDLICGGVFDDAGGVPCDNIARWDGVAWQALGSPDMQVRAITETPAGELVCGGDGPVRRWDGTTWQSIGLAMRDVHAFAHRPDGQLVAAGEQQVGGGIVHNHIARWSGTLWWPLGAGTDGWIEALHTLPNGDLVAGGRFTQAGGLPQQGLARWDGASWVPFREAVRVSTVAALGDGNLVVGGDFLDVGGMASAYVAELTTTCPASAIAFGGCGPLQLEAEQLGWAGATYRSRTSGLPASALPLVVRGLSTASLALTSLLPQSTAGCALLVAPEDVALGDVLAGELSASLAIPNAAAVLGVVFHEQVIALSPSTLGATSSNRLTVTVGSF